ncbi:MAG: hypothetical protein A3E37_01830 [Candidatus Andersenbacteria bacterium RIFCSPHIGHO2_12_FULL_46_9]|nr:MAG: hypothetical protein UW94_C0006G0028 [Parcubacteria group bacterium GW2011_GWA2_45_14]OGY33194.1 MAG: hypothetical protein A3B76_04945 [Candidatus Andersenbacteria bacterium RIFCSPHIGHO2_02_FULL_46_16]OGY38247.1 MAG: hypothetical protein A3I08_03680 [Candidatus Andersenbacteria bacterium RIFCSPLOWO2_02_FULL_46_11]OGY38526.1 MAG: hypothetical protein A3E37_01830 [Candidatus Andersenbacteria bacterium RIFCSPHIGHO2_12_FULL_46_9]OGY38925.1 MAG: hypothetical protein A3G57_02715 [Candidatus A
MTIEYETSDFLTASVLLMQKHPILSTDTSNPRRVVFVFEDSPRLQQNLTQLKRGELRCDPSDFWAAERRAKQLIYEGERL